MGLLVEGQWSGTGIDATTKTDGSYVRKESAFRQWISADGSSGFKAESGRYHLYVSLACPWAHRTLIYRRLKGLENHITVSVVHPLLQDHGWEFREGTACVKDDLFNSRFLYEIYQRADANYTGRVTVPILWDKQQHTIVSNESSEIIRMFNTEFNQAGATGPDFYPEPLREAIDEMNAFVYPSINNGVYKCGFATTQKAYDEAIGNLFAALDQIDDMLGRQPWLLGDALTEADWRLFPTLLRFDPVYVGHFKCNLRRIADYPNIQDYLKALYQYPGIKKTVNIAHIKEHYYASHRHINPTGVIPAGPELDLDAPHSRG